MARVNTNGRADRSRVPACLRLYSALLHRLPIMSGLTALAFNTPINRMFARCRGPAPARMRNGVIIQVDLQDYHGRVLYLFGTNDPKVQHAACALLSAGDIFLDIGANYSSIGIHAARQVGPTGHVHLFEPQKELAARVSAAIADAGITNVTLHALGLLDRDTELALRRPRHHSGVATVMDHGMAFGGIVETIPIRDISRYVGPLLAGRPFGAKVDVEGAEPLILPWLLRQPSLRFLIFEAAHNQTCLWQLVSCAGLTLYGLERCIWRRRLWRIDRSEDMAAFHDILAVRMPDAEDAPRRTTYGRLAATVRRLHAAR